MASSLFPEAADPPAPQPGQELPGVSRRRGEWRLPIALFVITSATTLLTGVELETSFRGLDSPSFREILVHPTLLLLGLPYAAAILAILGTHEMGHYLACRHYGIDATPPFFLPSPPGFLFGTFGAFIRIRAPITDRRALFDIGVAGPLAGFVVAVPVMLLGIHSSAWRPDSLALGGVVFGSCLLTKFLTAHLAPPALAGHMFVLGSVAMAGWVGLLATALNLLPVGQLDGGHIAYAVSGRFHTIVSRLCLAAFVLLGLRINESWLFWATVLILLSPRHPRLLEEERKLPVGRLLVAALAALILAVSFIPSPIRPAS